MTLLWGIPNVKSLNFMFVLNLFGHNLHNKPFEMTLDQNLLRFPVKPANSKILR